MAKAEMAKGFAPRRPGATTASGLPRDLEEAAASRLAIVALVAMATMAIALVASLFRQENLGARAGLERPAWLIPVGFAVSLGMWLAARSKRTDVATKLSLGIAYMILACALLAMFRHSLPYLPEDVLRGFSPVALAVLFFAIVVPMPATRMAIAATLAALTDPLVLGLTVAAGNPMPPANLWLWLFLPNAVGVGLAVVAARVAYGLGQSVHKARQMGSYRLVEKLGAGGMGEVWRAEHATLARPAAVKFVRPSMLGAHDPAEVASALRRFEREAQATAMLTSPHTIELYDYGVSDDGTFYYVMELLDGMDLETLLGHTRALAPERAAHLLLGVCHSLRDAHESGVVHRDIKPANIYVCKKGGEYDFVKLLDFGLARRVDTGAAEPRLTIAGDVIGTPQYLAPEAMGEEPVDGRTDLYSLGSVAYRMLAGREVFEEAGVLPLLTAHLMKQPKPLQELVPGIPPELARLVMGCLAKSPAERPASTAVLMQELQATGLAERWTADRAHAWWAALPREKKPPGSSVAAPAALGDAETVARSS
ncbi:MAG: protein kinase [Deltaproteobacteria bacterium]|nr:protein kinase [Deltaproteobacteria bacterium]